MPEVEINEIQAATLVATSIALNEKEVDGSEALSREEEEWDIWNN